MRIIIFLKIENPVMQETLLLLLSFMFMLPPITDTFGRTFRYLRFAVNERCNLRCMYCMAEDKVFPPRDSLLQTAEIKRLIDLTAHMGVEKIRFTGGEPLLHPDIIDIVSHATSISTIQSVHLTSNGVLLEKFLPSLLKAGLSGVNISIDSLNAKNFHKITRRALFSKVHASILAALNTSLTVKLNVVAMRNINDHELHTFAQWSYNHKLRIRFIELMPFDDQQIWKTGRFVQGKHIKETLYKMFPNIEKTTGSATEHQVFRIPKAKGELAIIPAYSRNICGACNRFRITADGRLRNCLYAKHETNIMEAMRTGADDMQLRTMIYQTMKQKHKDGWSAQKSEGNPQRRASMSQIGG